jgi:hypothetical protein
MKKHNAIFKGTQHQCCRRPKQEERNQNKGQSFMFSFHGLVPDCLILIALKDAVVTLKT